MVPLIAIKCTFCQKSIKRRSDSVFALQETWHKHCFRCLICKERLKDVFFPWQNRLYCRQHYLEYYAHSCPKCSRQITGLVMVSGDVSFHPECFRCQKCKHLIGHNDNYVFEERSNLYCKNCYEVDVGKYLKYKEFNIFRKAAIHQVHLCPSQLKKHHLQFKYKDNHKENILFGIQKKIKQIKIPKVTIEKSSDSSLKHGDTLLEINGTPVTGTNIKQFTKLLEAADTTRRISITIERLPEQSNTSTHSPATETLSSSLTVPVKACGEPSPCSSCDPEVYERNVSYFNFSVLKRCGSDSAVSNYRINQRKLAPVKEDGGAIDDGLSLKDKAILNRINSQTTEQTPIRKEIFRSHSLEALHGDVMNDFASMIKRELLKAESPLHRAQSMKVHTPDNNTSSCVFRPSDLETCQTIGKGFFGEVVLIKHKATGKEMVMKKLFDVDTESMSQFMKEVHVLKSLNHPNVLPFIGVMYQDTVLNLLLEYIKGGTLRALLKNKFIELPWKTKMLLAKDIASGMTYLHAQNVMHRDLKSKNVLIKKKEGVYTAVVADFGLASVTRQPLPFSPTPQKDTQQQQQQNLSPLLSPRPHFAKRCTVVGTAFWMAPEMLKEKVYDETVDIFSYGIVLCEIMSRLRNDGDTLPRTKQFGVDIELFKKMINPDYPDVMIQLLAACCDLIPDQRPPFDCCEKWLEAFLTHMEFDVPLPEEIDFQKEPQPLRLNSISKKRK